MSKTIDINSLVKALVDVAPLCEQALSLSLGQCSLRVRSNSSELLQCLAQYFAHVVDPGAEAEMEIIAIEREAPELTSTLGIEFIDWKREPGKSGRKDSYCDLIYENYDEHNDKHRHARLLRKVRTGMVFLQSEIHRIAAGPCLHNDNQVINFINVQYMNWLLQRGWQICHAAALVYHGRALAIAAYSGGGKSTLMLHMMENPAINFLTNDRLFIKKDAVATHAAGIPKLPRINPGTIVHNPRLQPLIPAQQREALLALPGEELWQLEQKYDVLIEQHYGPDRISAEAPLAAFLVLNWQRDSDQPMKLQRVDLAARRDLLAAIMKSPGPFYQDAEGLFIQDGRALDEQAYLDALDSVAVYEANGGIDFESLVQRLDELIG